MTTANRNPVRHSGLWLLVDWDAELGYHLKEPPQSAPSTENVFLYCRPVIDPLEFAKEIANLAF